MKIMAMITTTTPTAAKVPATAPVLEKNLCIRQPKRKSSPQTTIMIMTDAISQAAADLVETTPETRRKHGRSLGKSMMVTKIDQDTFLAKTDREIWDSRLAASSRGIR